MDPNKSHLRRKILWAVRKHTGQNATKINNHNTASAREGLKDWVFQQDNARLKKDFFLENNVALLDHPTCSPDLNPIENVWGWMAGEVYNNGRQFQTVDALREAILTTWSNVPTSLLETLASSMPKLMLKLSTTTVGLLTTEFIFDTLKVPCHTFPVITRPLVCYEGFSGVQSHKPSKYTL